MYKTTIQAKPSPTDPKIGIPNFKAAIGASPVSNRASQNPNYTPTTDWSTTGQSPSAYSPVIHIQTRNTGATATPFTKHSPVKKSTASPNPGFSSPVKKGQQRAEVPEDYMSLVWSQRVQAEGGIDYLPVERSPARSPVRHPARIAVKSPQSNKNAWNGGLKGQKNGQYMGKESIDDLIKASQVSQSQPGSARNLKEMVDKAKQSKEEAHEGNVVEKYIAKAKLKDSPTKGSRSREDGVNKSYGLFTPENYMSASRNQTEASVIESAHLTEREGGIDLSVSQSRKSEFNDAGYSRVNRPTYGESMWSSPKRTQVVEIGGSPSGEKVVEVVFRDAFDRYKEALVTSMENFNRIEEGNLNTSKQSKRKVVKEQASGQEQVNEQEKEEKGGCENQEAEVVKEEVLVEEKEKKEEEVVRTVERETEIVRDSGREERKVRSAFPQHHVQQQQHIFSIPETEKAEQESDHDEEEVEKEKEKEKKETVEVVVEEKREVETPREVGAKVEVISNVYETPTGDEKREVVTPKEVEAKVEVISNAFETPTGTGDVVEHGEGDSKDDLEANGENVLTVYQDKMAKVETWKRLGNQEKQIELLKEIVENLEDYEKGHVQGENEEEKKNVITHKIHAHNALAAELCEAGEYEKALESCRKVAEVDRTNLQALNKACQIHTKLGNTEKAKDIMTRMKKLMQTPMILQYNQQFLLGEIAVGNRNGSQGTSSQGDMLASRLSFFNYEMKK